MACRVVPLGDFRLDFMALSTDIHHFDSWFFQTSEVRVVAAYWELDHAEGEAWARGYARGSPVHKKGGGADGH